MDFPNLHVPPGMRELLLYAIPFLGFTFIGAAVLFLARDLLGKPKAYRNGNGNGNGHSDFAPRRRRNANGNGNGNGHVFSNGEKKNGNGHYGLAHELAIPRLAQPAEMEGRGMGTRMENWFARLLHECGAPYSRDVAFMTELAGGLLVGGVLFVWLENVLLAAVGFFAGMVLVISLYVLARNRRQRIMREQLPDAIEHLARAVRAGQTIDQALTLVGESTPQPLGLEIRRCAAQLEMGLSVDAAVRAMSRRVPVPEMRILASTFIVQRRAGGNLPLTLERLAKVVRDRLSYFRQFRAATAGSRMSLLIVSLTGPFVAGYMMIYRPESFDLFFQSTLGLILFGTSLTLYVVGLGWIYKLLRHNY
jgi:tight adherence protein B